MYFSRNREFGLALSKLRNFRGGGGLNPFGTPLIVNYSHVTKEYLSNISKIYVSYKSLNFSKDLIFFHFWNFILYLIRILYF
jgi:hypothetical protein